MRTHNFLLYPVHGLPEWSTYLSSGTWSGAVSRSPLRLFSPFLPHWLPLWHRLMAAPHQMASHLPNGRRQSISIFLINRFVGK